MATKKPKQSARKIPIPQINVTFPKDDAKVGVVKAVPKKKPIGWGVLGR